MLVEVLVNVQKRKEKICIIYTDANFPQKIAPESEIRLQL
jgi:hypothetical protein